MPVAAVLPNWLGDLVMAAPALRALGRGLGDEALDLFALEPLAPLARALFEAREVVAYRRESGLGRLRLRTRLARRMRPRGYRAAVLLPNSFSSALGAWRAGVPARVGTAMHGRSFLLSARVAPLGEREHQADAYLRVVAAALDGDPDARDGDELLHLAGDAREAAAAALRGTGLATEGDGAERFVVLAPGAAYGPAKQWGEESFAEVARALARTGVRTLVAGTRADAPLAERIARLAPDAGVVDLTGRTDLVALAGVLGLSAGFVGNDSGAAHLAAALGVPTVAVFLSTDPTRTAQRGPRVAILTAGVDCAPCLARTCPDGSYRCRGAVEPGAVVERLRGGGEEHRDGGYAPPRPARRSERGERRG
jgi:heptosyltransferase-2